MNKCIVLDKSYLVSASSEEILKLCLGNRLLMPDALLMELMRHKSPEKRKQRADCFRKLPKINNPIDLIGPVHGLIDYEINNRRNCTPIKDRVRNGSWYFHEGLTDPNWEPEYPNDADIREWEEELASSTKVYQQMNAEVDEIFPLLKDYKPGDSSEVIESLKHKVATDNDFIRSFVLRRYSGELRLNVDRDWALFRQAQVQLIYALDYVFRYGPNNPEVISRLIPHDFLDMKYCIIGVLAGGLATCDKELLEFFKLLCPEGISVTES